MTQARDLCRMDLARRLRVLRRLVRRRRYRAGLMCGAGFSNAERFDFTGGRISPLEVHSGWELG